jgi:kinesin family protein 3/17
MVDEEANCIRVKNPEKPDEEPKPYFFDRCYGEKYVIFFIFKRNFSSKQTVVYDQTARSIVCSCLEGFNGTIFAYGQTGTGKTHTMVGVQNVPELRGIIPNTFSHIFTVIGSDQQKHLIRVSFLEIYNEEIRDLLIADPSRVSTTCELRESANGSVYVQNLSQIIVKNETDTTKVMNRGNANRTVGATEMNPQSSRSHSIFTITFEIAEIGPDGKPFVKIGKLSLVDLAGSEKQSKTKAENTRLKEAIKINWSLSALGNVINALTSGKAGQHIPYRDSKLTRFIN